MVDENVIPTLTLNASFRLTYHSNVSGADRLGGAQMAISRRSLYGDRPHRMRFIPLGAVECRLEERKSF